VPRAICKPHRSNEHLETFEHLAAQLTYGFVAIGQLA